jgi:hypothetical protein
MSRPAPAQLSRRYLPVTDSANMFAVIWGDFDEYILRRTGERIEPLVGSYEGNIAVRPSLWAMNTTFRRCSLFRCRS